MKDEWYMTNKINIYFVKFQNYVSVSQMSSELWYDEEYIP